jgi:hypothetical protein
LPATTEITEDIDGHFCEVLIKVIDEFIASIFHQDLVDSNRVQDFCLDLRNFVSENCQDV